MGSSGVAIYIIWRVSRMLNSFVAVCKKKKETCKLHAINQILITGVFRWVKLIIRLTEEVIVSFSVIQHTISY